jgi:hypothetical protein
MCRICAPEQGKSGTILALTAMIIFNHASWNPHGHKPATGSTGDKES